MKRIIKLLLFFNLSLLQIFAQEENPVGFTQLDRFYHKDYNSFREYIQKNSFFPPDAFNNTGVLLAGFILSPEGKIVNVFTLNSLSSFIDNQVLDLFESSSEFWKPLNGEKPNKNSMIILPIVYCLKNTEYIVRADNLRLELQDEILLTAMMGQEQMSSSNYINTDRLRNLLDEFVIKGKYEKAKDILVELLKRDPLNTEYFTKLIDIESKLGNIDDACKNLKFVKTYLIEQPEKVEVNCNQ